MSINFQPQETLLTITERYPESLDFFIANGFSQFKNQEQLNKMGASITLEQSLKQKGLGVDVFSQQLREHLIEVGADDQGPGSDAINLVGLLPCPVRIPLMEAF